METKNRILVIFVLIILIFGLSGCAECISTEYEDVEVTVIDKYHTSMWMQPVVTGKVVTVVTHPAVYRITVEYNGVQYTLADSDTYNKYEDKVGQTTTGKLEIKTYNDGTVKYNIVSLK